ncbi:GerD family protein [Heliomicrobium modesticaldum]|nr:GerD family protein [Heliomicrobium modesticaldum]
MQRLLWLLIIAFLLTTGIASCSPQRRPAETQSPQQGQGQQSKEKPDYQDMKTMMIDIIKTDEYQQRLARMIRDPEFQAMVLSQDPKFQKTLQEMLRDAKFQENLALVMKEKEIRKSIKETVKESMDDPEIKKKIQAAAKSQEGSKGGDKEAGQGGGGSSGE